MYLERFYLPLDREDRLIMERACENGGPYPYIDNIYPCRIFAGRDFEEIWFKRVTVFYGGNGSGKSTLLNLIAQKLQLNRIAPFNSGELYDKYVNACGYVLGEDDGGFKQRIPNGSRIISSDDIFDYMLTVRANNKDIGDNIELAKKDWFVQKYGRTVKMQGLEDYEQVRVQVLSRKKSLSRRQYIRRLVGTEVRLQSNGETALEYFKTKLKNDTLYCLDEPENSLSPKLQLELLALLEKKARYCGCQFVIATHSPFLLSIEGARIYDLDSTPIVIRPWWELENTKTYFRFFEQNRHLFMK